MMSKLFVFVMGLMLLPLVAFGPADKYSESFGEAYHNALKFCKEEAPIFHEIGKQYDINPQLMSAIVFPELMRFNAFRDFFENQGLEIIYLEKGSHAVDFSIGHFQMKPSFAEFMESKTNEDLQSQWAKDFQDLCSFDAGDDATRRAERLRRLQDKEWQLRYLAAFIKYSMQDISHNALAEKKIRLLATRYNCGPQKSWSEVEPWLNKKTFPYGPSYKGEKQFNYSQIALDYFQTIARKSLLDQ